MSARELLARKLSRVGDLLAPRPVDRFSHLARLIDSMRSSGLPEVDLRVLVDRLEAESGGPIDRITMHPRLTSLGSGSIAEMAALSALAAAKRPRHVLEFGTYDGCSTWHLWANTSPETSITTIDLPPRTKVAGSTDEGLQGVGERPFLPRDPRVRLVEIDSRRWTPDVGGARVDFCFIDAGHSYECVQNDTQKALAVMAEGGLIVWHDSTWKEDGYGVNSYLLNRINDGRRVDLIKVGQYDYSGLSISVVR